MKTKYYFLNEDANQCHEIEYFKGIMQHENITEIEVIEAIPIKSSETDFMYCKYVGEVGEKGGCGKNCDVYSPKSGKSGICKHRGRLYDFGEKVTIYLK